MPKHTSRPRACWSRACWSAALALTLALGNACRDSIDVLDHAAPVVDASLPPERGNDAGGGGGKNNGGAGGDDRGSTSTPHRPDASKPMSPDSGDTEPRLDARVAASPCDPQCGGGQLCAIDRCVDAAGTTRLAASFKHTCAVSDGQLFCWGLNEYGQLGVGDLEPRALRTRVGTWNDWLSVTASEKESCAIRAPGRLYCWGNNTSGELGLGDTDPRQTPAQVGDFAAWREVSCGGDSCCAMQGDGALYCWGANREGKGGQDDAGGSPDLLQPARVARDIVWGTIAVAQGHVCAISDAGALYCWGRNTDLQLGIGSADPIQVRAPTRIGDATDWRAINGSQHHTCGVRGDGSLWCWGTNAFFELGAPSDVMSSSAPRRVGSDADWLSAGTGWFHSCAQKQDGRLFCWGRSIEGQLGQGMHDEPQEMLGMVATPERWLRFALGNFYTCGVEQAGALYCWGVTGALGFDDADRRYVPALVP